MRLKFKSGIKVSPAAPLRQFLSMERKKKKRGSEKRVGKQRRYAVSKQKTMVSGLAQNRKGYLRKGEEGLTMIMTSIK